MELTIEAEIARELIGVCRRQGMEHYVETVHYPEINIPDGEYWRVTVERVLLDFAPVEPFLEMAAV